MQSWICSIITPVFSVTWSLRNHYNMLICSSTNIYYYYQFWKKVVLPNIFVETIILWWTESSKEHTLFEMEIFCNILNVFTIIFYQHNASLLNKIIQFSLQWYWILTVKLNLNKNYHLEEEMWVINIYTDLSMWQKMQFVSCVVRFTNSISVTSEHDAFIPEIQNLQLIKQSKEGCCRVNLNNPEMLTVWFRNAVLTSSHTSCAHNMTATKAF